MFRAIGTLLFVLLFLVVALFFGLAFANVNLQMVTVNYLLGAATWPLAGVMVGAFAVGCVVAAVIGFSIIWSLRWRVARLRDVVAHKDHELNALRQKAGLPVRQV